MASCVSRSHRPVRSAGCLALRLLRPHQAPGSRLVRVGDPLAQFRFACRRPAIAPHQRAQLTPLARYQPWDPEVAKPPRGGWFDPPRAERQLRADSDCLLADWAGTITRES